MCIQSVVYCIIVCVYIWGGARRSGCRVVTALQGGGLFSQRGTPGVPIPVVYMHVYILLCAPNPKNVGTNAIEIETQRERERLAQTRGAPRPGAPAVRTAAGAHRTAARRPAPVSRTPTGDTRHGPRPRRTCDLR